MNVRETVRGLSAAFERAGDPERANQEKRYHKSELRFHGIPAKSIQAAAAEIKREHPRLERAQLERLVNALWATKYFDLRSLALELLQRYRKLLGPEDMALLEGLVRDSRGWAHVDCLSTSIISPLVERYPQLHSHLDGWSTDDDFWVRRAAMLGLLRPLRAGAGDFDRFAAYAAPMLEEEEFFIRKAIGWILREVSKKRPELARAFLEEHIERVSGLTLREGSKRLVAQERERLLERYTARKR